MIDSDIEEIERHLAEKRKQKEGYLMEKQKYEREIDKARSAFRDQLIKLEHILDKVQKTEEKNTRDREECKREQDALLEYEESYKTRIEGFQKEIRDTDDFQGYLVKSVELIDSTLSEKESCKDKAFQIKQEINQMKIKKDNAVANKDYILEKIARIDSECEDLQTQINQKEKKIGKLTAEKKKAADQKKFKEASKA